MLNMKHYWLVSDWVGVDIQIGKLMRINVFNRAVKYIRLPKDSTVFYNTWGDCHAYINVLSL